MLDTITARTAWLNGNGLMAIPTLIAVLGSIALLRRLTREFFATAR